MNGNKSRAWIWVTAVLALLLLASQAQALPQQQTNLINNPSFEFPYGDKGAANGWGRWHRNSSEDVLDDCENGYSVLPAWSPETNGALVRDGGVSQHIGNQWRTWEGGVFQTVQNVNAGSTYRFTVYAYAHGGSEDFPAPSETGLQTNVRVGIDPNGSGLWNDADVFWGGTINPHNGWQAATVEVTAAANQISVFTSADWGVQGINQCRKHLDIWFDSAELIEVGPPPTNTPPPAPTLPPPPPATLPPSPVPATNTPEVPPTDTPVPPTETPTTPPGGTICVNAFADANANGMRDDNEGFMGNVTFTVASGSEMVGQAVSTGTESPFCFEGLEAGSYQIAQIVPGRLEMTTAQNATIQVEVGRTVGVEFGSRLRDNSSAPPAATEVAAAVEPTDAAAESPPDTPAAGGQEGVGFDLVAISGLFVMVLAVVLLGVLIFLVLRRSNS